MFHEIDPHTLNIAYEPREPFAADRVLLLADRTPLIRETAEGFDLPTVGELSAPAAALRYLFRIDDTALWLGDASVLPPADLRPTAVRALRSMRPMHRAYAVTLGWRLSEWYRENVFCGVCGQRLKPGASERSLCCEACGAVRYPQICPSVIVLIRSGEYTLLTRYAAAHSAYRRYALVAGYVESGETPEETVRREVWEEVGLRVKQIRYYKSQPWPISGALLLGYVCDLDGDDTVRLNENELSTAEWVRRDQMPDRSDDVSLTSEMMEQFRLGVW